MAFSPDEKYLYVAESVKKFWMRYRVQPDGSLTDGSVFIDCSSDPAKGVPDGLRVDAKGNMWGAGRAAYGSFLPKASISGPSRCRRWSAIWSLAGKTAADYMYIAGEYQYLSD